MIIVVYVHSYLPIIYTYIHTNVQADTQHICMFVCMYLRTYARVCVCACVSIIKCVQLIAITFQHPIPDGIHRHVRRCR